MLLARASGTDSITQADGRTRFSDYKHSSELHPSDPLTVPDLGKLSLDKSFRSCSSPVVKRQILSITKHNHMLRTTCVRDTPSTTTATSRSHKQCAITTPAAAPTPIQKERSAFPERRAFTQTHPA